MVIDRESQGDVSRSPATEFNGHILVVQLKGTEKAAGVSCKSAVRWTKPTSFRGSTATVAYSLEMKRHIYCFVKPDTWEG